MKTAKSHLACILHWSVKSIMAASEFIENLRDVFALFGEIRVRRMFGGYGVYRDGLMFALAADEVLYLKADADSAASFIERGLPPFEYEKRGKTVRIAYYAAPDEIFDDPETARKWADLAYAAALRAQDKRA